MSVLAPRRRSALALTLARPYARRRFVRAFDGAFVHGIERLNVLLEHGSVIVAANHVAWWDALFLVLLDQRIGCESYCFMDADNLARLPFFAWLGAIGLDRTSPRRGLLDLDAGAELLTKPGRVLWIFPQGCQRPAHLRPLHLASGVRRLARRSGCPIVPLSLNYLFREHPQPTAAAAFGEPIAAPFRAVLQQLENQLCHGLDRIDQFVTGQDTAGFQPVTTPREQSSLPHAGRLLAASMNNKVDQHA